jgi:hypothetical protein
MTGTLGSTSTPVGAPLAVSDPVNVASIGSSFALTTFGFSGANRVALAAATNYCIAVSYAGGDTLDWLAAGTDVTSPTATGNSSFSGDGASWSSSTVDVCFYVYVASLSQIRWGFWTLA